jgi:SAM-dependent methyltransferase
METVNCYNCASEDSSFYASENGYTLVRCAKCKLLYVNNPPKNEDIQEAHKLGKHRGVDTIDVTGSFKNRKVAAYVRILAAFFADGTLEKPKTWLDIGCGHGEFLLALQRFSKGKVVARGLEPNVQKQKSAQRRGLDVSYFDLDKHTAEYDIISALNVYSHLPNPPTIISGWKTHLKTGGELFLETGDTAQLSSEDHYRPFYLPDHLSFASEEIVRGILERVGFEVLAVRKYPFIEVDFFSIAKEMAKVFWPNKASALKFMMNRKAGNTDMYIRARDRRSLL